MTWRRWLTTAAAVAVTTLLVAPPAVAADGLAITGYVGTWEGTAAVRPSLAALTTVAVDGVGLRSDGAAVASPDDDAQRLLAQAHAGGRRAELLVSNYSDRLGDFSEPVAYRLLDSAAHRAAVVRQLAADVAAGWDGIHLDLESLQPRDRAGLTAFAAQLRAALPAGASLAMAVMAAGSAAGYRARGYDLPALATSLDWVVLMAYDQHGPGWSGPGPIGGLPWTRTVLGALLGLVPAARVDLGVAGYGYTWPAAGGGTSVSDADARAGAVGATWDATQAEWHGTLPDGGAIWWSDRRSLQVREALATSRGLHGVAVWSLGQSDPIR